MNLRLRVFSRGHAAVQNRRRRSCFAVRLLTGLLLLAGCSTFGQQLVQNGGFETGDFTGWTQSGNTEYTFVTNTPRDVHSGLYGADLGPSNTLGFLSQTIATVSGQSYALSFWFANPLAGTPNEFLVSWNGTNLFDQTNLPAFAWSNLQFTVSATSTSTVLEFGFRNDPNNFALDDVSVTADFTFAQGTTWFATNSPYLVISNLVVTNLVIQPGVTVLFNGPYSLTVTGLLQAVGKSNNPIVFEPATNSGGWQGIYFSSANTNSAMAYCQITGATNGALRFTNTPFALNNCTISGNSGPLGGGIYSDSALTLTNCYILSNMAFTEDTNSPYSAHGGGICILNGPLTLQSSFISNNMAMAPDLAFGGGIDCESGNVSMNNCTIVSNLASAGIPNWNSLTNWVQTSAPSEYWETIAASATGTKLAAVVDGGGTYTSTNSGLVWNQTSAPSGINQASTASSADGTKLVAAVGDLIYTSTNSGLSWTEQAGSPSAGAYFIASSADCTRLAAIVNGVPFTGTNATIYTSTNSGSTWIQTSAPDLNWQSIASSADGTKLAAASYDYPRGSVYTSTNSGITWQQTSAPNNVPFWSIASSADGTKLAAYAFGNIDTSTNSGATWNGTRVGGGPGDGYIASSSDGAKLSVIEDGEGIFISTNSGINWTATGAPSLKWYGIASSADGTKLAAVVFNGGIYTAQANILDPTAFGGGIYLNNSNSILNGGGCNFDGNEALGQSAEASSCGGAISFGQGSLLNCTFTGNQATNGGAIYLNGNGPFGMSNCLLATNSAMAGGAFYTTSNAAVEFIENTTVVSNSPDGFNGYIGTIHDSILFFNSANEIVNGSPTVTYSDVQGGYNGTGNLNVNPQFTNGTNYYLSASSPVIDAGDPNPIYNDEAFPPSQNGDRNDMGAYGGPYAALWPGFADSVPVVLVNGQPATPYEVFNIASTSPPTISFTNGFAGGSFEYTLDGSDPLDNVTYKADPFVLTQSAMIRVVAYSSDFSMDTVSAPVTVNVLPYCSFTASSPGGGGVSGDPFAS